MPTTDTTDIDVPHVNPKVDISNSYFCNGNEVFLMISHFMWFIGPLLHTVQNKNTSRSESL
jgi:hypothetical protein